MRRFAIGFGLAIFLIWTLPASAVGPIKIIDTKTNAELSPSVTDGWEAWTAYPVAHPKRNAHGYVRPTGGAGVRIPIAGDVRTGNFITSGPYAGKIVLRSKIKGNNNIYLYDPVANTISKPPKGVNTSKSEFSPTVSGDYLAFIRGPKSGGKLLLYQFSTSSTVVIRSGVYNTMMNGDYVAYSFCGKRSCPVGRYQISTDSSVRMPAPAAGRQNYYAAVAEDGTMYWAEGSRNYCGRHTKIRTNSGGSVSTLWAAPVGDEVDFMQVNYLAGSPTLAYSLAICPYSSNRWGAYRIDV